MPFYCNICEEESTRICASCTKDTCGNHLCDKCRCCSDCCSCEVALNADEPPRRTMARDAESAENAPFPEGEPPFRRID